MSIKKVTITEVKHISERDGNPLIYSKGPNEGKPYTSVGIKTEQTGDEFYWSTVMAGGRGLKIEAGQSLLLDITESPNPKGGVYKNFKFPSKEALEEFIANQ